MVKVSVNGKKIGRPREADKWIKRKCLGCGKKFEARWCYVKRGQMRYCSNDCGKAHLGEKNGRWRGGRHKMKQGYIKIYSPV